MRVSIFVNNYFPSRGGVQEHFGRLAEGLVARHGMQVDVLTSDALLAPAGPSAGRIPVGEERLNGVVVHRRPVARRCHGALRSARRAARRIGRYEPGDSTLLVNGPFGLRYASTARRLARRSDVVVGVSAPTASLWYASHLAPARVPTVAVPLLHSDGGQARPWVLRALRTADVVVANTRSERRWIADHGVCAENLHVIPPGCDADESNTVDPEEARRHLGLDPAPTVGFIGRLTVHKGIDTLIRAMRGVWAACPDARLLVAGPPAGLDVGSLLDDLDPEDRARVRSWGEFTDDERDWLIAACDVVAHPSRSESFGMVTVEAWTASRPVVVADIDVTRELVADGVDGVLIPVGDESALTRALVGLLRSPEDRDRLGRAGRTRVDAEFAWPVVIDRWAELLQDVVRADRRERVR